MKTFCGCNMNKIIIRIYMKYFGYIADDDSYKYKYDIKNKIWLYFDDSSNKYCKSVYNL